MKRNPGQLTAIVSGNTTKYLTPGANCPFAHLVIAIGRLALFWLLLAGCATATPTYTSMPPTATLTNTPLPQPANTKAPIATVVQPTAAPPTSLCPVSTDATFGYTKENPIKVGGGDFGGPPREEAYLNALRGPNGETISYARFGSIPFGDTILDGYEIHGLQKAVTLYIDEYVYVEPQAPVRFTCASAFPLSSP